jgi:predicted metal-dependent hydrolase
MSNIDDFPEYSLRRSTRATRLRLQISSSKGLQVIAPSKYDLTKIPDFLMKHKEWINKHLAKLKPLHHEITIPEELNLFALQETWKITYIHMVSKTCEAREFFEGKLMVIGNVNNKKAVKRALIQWLFLHAKEHLLPWLDKISQKTGISYKDAIIRFTRSRWGSCTADKRISLSPSLLFLTKELTEHIMLHELCHTVHLDHSSRFWRFFEKHSAHSLKIRKQVTKAHQLLPLWLENL